MTAATITETHERASEQPSLFAVGLVKFVVMSIATFGGYAVYSMYKQWQQLGRAAGEDLHPVARAIFGPFFFLELVERIDAAARRMGIGPPLPSSLLTIWYILSCITFTFQTGWNETFSTGWIFFSWMPIAFLQARVNQLNAAMAPSAARNTHFTVWNWVAVVVFIALTARRYF